MQAMANKSSLNPALWDAYRVTFQTFSRNLQALKILMASTQPDRAAMDAALCAVEKAHLAHNAARDKLAQALLQKSLPAAANDVDLVKRTAELLWELAGRPQGTQEDDWRRAERVIECATAA